MLTALNLFLNYFLETQSSWKIKWNIFTNHIQNSSFSRWKRKRNSRSINEKENSLIEGLQWMHQTIHRERSFI